jgi:hypothetical protein
MPNNFSTVAVVEKFGLLGHNMTFVLDSDGSVIDDDVLEAVVQEGSVLMVLSDAEIWHSQTATNRSVQVVNKWCCHLLLYMLWHNPITELLKTAKLQLSWIGNACMIISAK